jgi:lipopolysaccharide transport system permease protein
VLVPLALYLLGLVWFLAGIGAFARDVAYLMITIAPVMMIISPVFYTVAGLPEHIQFYVWINPLAAAIETGRALLLGSAWPPLLAIVWLWVAGALTFRGGYVFFMRYKGIMVDVI